MNQRTLSSSNRILYLDILKIIGAFMVCFYHLNTLDMGYCPEKLYLPNLSRLIMNFCAMSIPLFFMVNGALLLRKPYSISKIFVRFIKLYMMFVFWSIVIHGVLSLLVEGRIVFNVQVFLMKGTHYTVHLWFLRTAAILTLLTPILHHLYCQTNRLLLYVLLLALLIFPFLYNYILLVGRLLNITAFLQLERTGAGTMYSIVYFILGKILSDHAHSKNTNPSVRTFLFPCLLTLVGWILVTVEVTLWTNINHTVFDGVNGSFPTIGALLMAVGAFTLISRLQLSFSQRVNKIITFTGSHIIGIYLFHPIFIHLFKSVFSTSIIISASLTIIIMLASLLITVILKKIPLIRQLLTT